MFLLTDLALQILSDKFDLLCPTHRCTLIVRILHFVQVGCVARLEKMAILSVEEQFSLTRQYLVEKRRMFVFLSTEGGASTTEASDLGPERGPALVG